MRRAGLTFRGRDRAADGQDMCRHQTLLRHLLSLRAARRSGACPGRARIRKPPRLPLQLLRHDSMAET